MKLLRKLSLILPAALLAVHTAYADSFVVQSIQVEGLTGISQQTVINYLPVKVGQTLDTSDTSNIIAALYQTGFFSNVSLSRLGNTLIVHVNERPVIAKINIVGNQAITTPQINSVLKDIGLQQGQVLDQSELDQVTKSLQNAYDTQGRYNARVTTDVTPVARNRVNVTINISEGRVALVEKIHFIGNHVFSQRQLTNAFTLTTPKWDSFLTSGDHYSKDDLNKSLEALSNYYFDHGYLHFKIVSANAVLTPDHKSVYVVVYVSEGPQYRLSGYNFGGDTILPPSAYQKLPAVKALKSGEVFSRQKANAASDAITSVLGDQGYAFADVNVIPTISECNKTVFITYFINPGNRVYVRRITFTGNTSTSNNVLRSAMRQSEGELFSSSNVSESTRQLNLLGYLTGIKENTSPVPGSQNQVDLNYAVNEQPSAQATAGAGYGSDGFVLNAGVNESNFMGTGKQVGVNFSQSSVQRSYSFNYNNPYYTADGVQRGFNLYDTQTEPGEVNLAPYSFSDYGGNIIYTIPFSAKDDYQIGVGLQHTNLKPGYDPAIQISQFVMHQGQSFDQLMITGGWTRNGLDRAFFPTSGMLQTAGVQVSAPCFGTALDYYKLSYQINGYQPLPAGFIGAYVGSFGYGGGYGNTDGLPFFTNYYAGGLGVQGQVRGYQSNTIGPRDSMLNPYGGNTLLSGSLQLILPGFLSGDSYRTSVFVDSGDVYNTWDVYNTFPSSQTGIQLGQLRYSTGVDVQWRLPVLNAIVEFSLAKALNPRKGDETQPFAFNIGGNL